MSARCHYCGAPAFARRRTAVVCLRHMDLPRFEPSVYRERQIQRPRRRGLAG